MKRKTILVFMALLLTVGIVSAQPKKQAAPQTPIVEQNTKPATIVEAFGKLAQNLVAQAIDKPTFAFMAFASRNHIGSEKCVRLASGEFFAFGKKNSWLRKIDA
ncbi:MAG: hypothetical protein K2N58_11565 [Treponemataceae bacterium]|nr:hypothetical protein [Treponemataceae bacterium]